MTLRRYHDDSYLRSIKATVSSVDEHGVALDQTVFYARGGGQPGDTGTLVTADGRRFPVTDTINVDGDTRHVVGGDDLPAPGDVVQAEIDWERRYQLMKMHTGLHLLGSLIPVPVTGGSVGVERSRLDFDLGDHNIDKETLTEGLRQLVAGAHPLDLESITDAELDANPGLVRTMSVQPPRGVGTIRMVRIMDVDFQPCGGTHVNNTSEIGDGIRVAKIENKGKRNRRVHIVLDGH